MGCFRKNHKGMNLEICGSFYRFLCKIYYVETANIQKHIFWSQWIIFLRYFSPVSLLKYYNRIFEKNKDHISKTSKKYLWISSLTDFTELFPEIFKHGKRSDEIILHTSSKWNIFHLRSLDYHFIHHPINQFWPFCIHAQKS